MPSSHNVGSLFVNITGSSKGLKRALSSAKKEIGGFGQGVGDLFGQGRVTAARREAAKAATRMETLRQYQALGPSRVKGSRVGFAKEMGRVLREQGAAKTELTAATASRDMRVFLASLGISIGAVASILRSGVSMGQQSIQRHMKFGAIGPMGPRFISEKVETLMKQIRHAQSPEGSLMLAREAERAKQWEEVGRKWEGVADFLSESLLGIVQFFTDPMNLLRPTGAAMEQGARRRTEIPQTSGPGVG